MNHNSHNEMDESYYKANAVAFREVTWEDVHDIFMSMPGRVERVPVDYDHAVAEIFMLRHALREVESHLAPIKEAIKTSFSNASTNDNRTYWRHEWGAWTKYSRAISNALGTEHVT